MKNRTENKVFTRTTKGAELKKIPKEDIKSTNPAWFNLVLSPNGRILSQRILGLSYKMQKIVAEQIKKARYLGFIKR